MKTIRKKVLSSICAIVMLASMMAVPVSAAPTYGYGFASRPITVYADNSFNASEISQLREAISVWNSTRVGTVITYGGQRSLNSFYWNSDGINGIIKASMGSSSLTSMTGVTSPKTNGSNIVEADIAINKDLRYTNNATTSGVFYLKSVFIHELGHLLGLADVNDQSSVMHQSYTGRTALSSQDIDILDSLY